MSTPQTPPPCPLCLKLGIDPRTPERDRYLHPHRHHQETDQ